MQVLLVHPPIYDFTAYDFWLKPYGMLRVAGMIRHATDLTYFDYLVSSRHDEWGRGRFPKQPAEKPAVFAGLRRRYWRFGIPRETFRELLRERRFDVALIQAGMTYWYPGVQEVIEDLRRQGRGVKIVVGGVYPTLCPGHARRLEADMIVEGGHLEPLWRILPQPQGRLPWRIPSMGNVAAMKLGDGCPFRCTYCSVPQTQPCFSTRPVEDCLCEAAMLAESSVRHVAFYDDALLFQPESALHPFLEGVLRMGLPLTFHTPNALNVRLLTPETARLMVRAGCRNFFLGYESRSSAWMKKTGGKASADEFAAAVSWASGFRRAGTRGFHAVRPKKLEKSAIPSYKSILSRVKHKCYLFTNKGVTVADNSRKRQQARGIDLLLLFLASSALVLLGISSSRPFIPTHRAHISMGGLAGHVAKDKSSEPPAEGISKLATLAQKSILPVVPPSFNYCAAQNCRLARQLPAVLCTYHLRPPPIAV